MSAVLRAAVVSAILDGIIAVMIAARGGAGSPRLLLVNACFGAVAGLATAGAVGWAIRRLHSIGCIGAIAVGIGILTMAAWVGTSTTQVATAATLALIFPLWSCAAAVTGLMVKPDHPDRRK